MEVKTKFVSIPTFVNPHLFWIIETNSDEREKALNHINKRINECINRGSSLNDSFEIGEIVAVRLEDKYYRALLEDVPKAKTQEKSTFHFLCWLIDYGIMCEIDIIYKLPSSLKKVAPLAFQACLNNVAYVRQNLTFDNKSGLPVKINEPISVPSFVAHQVSLELMSNLSDLQFNIEKKVDGIFVGDILYKDNNELKSLRQALVERGVLIIDETMFKEIQENIYSYKEAHLWLIAQICRKLNSLKFLKLSGNDLWCKNIISKYLAEFGDSDLYDDDELSRPFYRGRSKSRNSTNDSQNNSINSGSDTEVLNKSDSLINSKEKSPSSNRLKTLLEKMKKQKQDSEKQKCISSSCTSDNSNSFATDNAMKIQPSASSSRQQTQDSGKFVEKEKIDELFDTECKNRLANSTVRERVLPNNVEKADDLSNGDCKSRLESSTVRGRVLPNNSEKDDELSDADCKNRVANPAVKKRVLPNNAVFVPGGATFSLLNMKKKPAKTFPNDRKPLKISEDEDLSDCPAKNVTDKCVRDESTPSDDTSTTEESKSKEVEKEQVNQMKVKPFCSCKQCQHWTTDSDWMVDTKFLDESKKSTHLAIHKPQTLFVQDENQDVDTDRTIISLDYSSKTKLQKQSMLKVLVHGDYSQAPARSVSDVYFHETIRNNLNNLKYREAKRIQIYTWPAILRQQHVFMVNGPQTGKTMAYLPVILTFLLEKNERYQQFLSKTHGPIAIVLCANTQKCEEIYDLSKTLLAGGRLKVSLITYPFSHVNTKYVDMLVTTPTILMDLVKQKAINFKRLCHLILEDGDKTLKTEPEVMNGIFDLTQSMLSNRVHPKPVQLVVCGEHWDLRLEHLMRRLSKVPLICIGNYLEATLYGKIQFSMKFINSACKEHELKNLLKDTFKICKSVILCKEEEIEEVQTILMLKGIDATVISESMSKEDILYLEEVWTQCKGGDYTVLVCSDFILNTLLTVTSAALLIHYSLPNSWTQFVKRFGCLLENCRSPLDKKQIRMKCQSVILCDENCEEHMPKFFNFINSTELKNQMSEKFTRFAEGLKHMEEQKKVKNKIDLCGTLKLFGACSTTYCPWRHVIDKDLDVADYLPQSGKIKFKIVHIHDVTTYSVQLLQHIDMDNNVNEFRGSPDLTEDLKNVIRVSKKQVTSPVVGHQYAYYDIDEEDGVYYRCDVLEVDGNGFVKIKLLDKGNVINTNQKRLFRLPKEFKNKPRKVIDVYLANFTPPYHDENFSAKSFFNLKTLLEQHDYRNTIMTADIHLQIGHSLWVKNVYEEVTVSEKVLPTFQLTREILVSKLAEYNNNQLNSLYKLCKEASISLPLYEKLVKRVVKEEKKIEPQWGHLDSSEVNEVTFSAAISPDEIYVRLNKFNEQLYNLQKEIQASLKKANYPKLQNIEIGTVCLAKDPEGIDYSRIIVKNLENDKALCFFVDFGDEAVIDIGELKYIYNKFISKLPFQSIQCRLQGIKPVLDDWQDDINDILYEYATEPNSDIFRLLFVKVCSKEGNVLHPKQNRYSVFLKDGFGEKKVLINSLLIDCGVAIPNSEQIEDFEVFSGDLSSEESDEELDRIIDICRKTKEVEENAYVNGTNEQHPKDDEANDDMELFLIDADEFFRSLLASKNDVKPKSNRELPAIQAAPAVDYCTPDVYWSQTEKYIKMDIRLHDVNNYNLNLTKGTILHFKTEKKDKTYKLNLMLYQKVSSIQHTAMGPQIRVTLTKTNSVEWPRLILSKQRVRNIHYDVSAILVKEEKHRKILELPQMSDDEDTDNIDVMYHVTSDLESDLDQDLPEDSD